MILGIGRCVSDREKRSACLALLFRRKFLQFERSLGFFKLGTRQF